MKKVIRFFAIDNDLLYIMDEVEKNMDLQYASAGVFSSKSNLAFEVYDKGANIPNLSKATSDSAVSCESFLVCQQGIPIQQRDLVFNDGTKGFAIDQLYNQHAATLVSAGLLNDEIILYGTLGAAHGTESAMKIIRAFEKNINNKFTKVKAFWVGPNALIALKKGKRLTIASQSPRSYDLSMV